MRFDIFTLFPGIFEGPLRESMIKRAIDAGLLDVQLHNIRDYAAGKHQVTDDYPYGGGGGMVMKPEPVFAAVESILGIRDEGSGIRDQGVPITDYQLPVTDNQSPIPIVLLTPQGRVFNQSIAYELAQHDRVALICGRYEGFDERIREHLATDEISIGDFVLTGGELVALVVLDAVIRLKPGALGDPEGASDDSHASGLLEYPHYTRPLEFRGWGVPEVLLSGDHAKVDRWRREQALRRTWLRRPDMLAAVELSKADRAFLDTLRQAPDK
ncbi:MAG: tRNA (guanosine(37)-N1)-methyltransferase TrmD [Chloroflexi bacterium]|nr:tRNA (guanosine(37)-N1)-methyltransferase TrmD [Chloroflexota bacterium]